MANNNYAGFNYGGTQYSSPGGSGYSGGSVSYPAVTNATYANAAAYQSAAVAAGNGSYAAGNTVPGSYGGYGSEYGRAALPSYDASKTYYQQAASNYNTAPTATVSKTHYSAPPVKNINPIGTKPATGKEKAGVGVIGKQAGIQGAIPTAPGVASYTNYDAALYSAASVYAAQKQQGSAGAKANGSVGAATSWPPYRKGATGGPGPNVTRPRTKPPPRPQQLHYCEVCKISCAGPQTYREHLDGQKHKKREASLKMQASAQTTSQNRGNNYHCELCDVTCTGTDAYAAHVRGAKHQKVVKLHQKLGKPIPPDEPKKLAKINFVPASGTSATNGNAAGGNSKSEAGAETQGDLEGGQEETNAGTTENTDNIKPVGGEYIEEVKDDEGKILSFNCKLCDCKFNDPNAKEMHMKGRRHRLQYKRKVQPDLVVDFKPTPRQRRLAEARAQRALMQAHRNANGAFGDNYEGGGGYWDEQRRRAQYDDEYDYNNWLARSFGNQRFGGRMANGPPPFFGMIPGGANIRRPESSDDRHAIARHAEIYPKEEELQVIQRIVSHTERALKYVSDTLADDNGPSAAKKEKNDSTVKDGRDNQMLSFQKDADSANVRILKGVMRVGFLAKGLLLQGDNSVELVVLCSEKPTIALLKRVALELPEKLKEVAGDSPVNYKVEIEIEESAVMVRDDSVSVKISLTSPLLREAPENVKAVDDITAINKGAGDAALLPRQPCLRALAELRHAKWFQARATGLQSCVMVIRILRDLCQRIQSWQALPQWSMELLVEKVISSAGFPISPGDCLRRIMEALASGFLINGPGILDPCEKEPTDALHDLTKQQREDLTVSAQMFLRYIAFRQIYKVLGMEQLPPLKFPLRPWRGNRKRRRSSGKGGQAGDTDNADNIDESASDEKIAKKDGIEAAA
uniref:DZF domain-containing protein n=1 Tax=Glossina austeni TaxID=7395 RepID=A0A1A9UPF0_GLOAU